MALPRSRWWVFGINTTIRPLVELAHRPEIAARVHTAVTSLDVDTAAYKDMAGWRGPLAAWLARASAGEFRLTSS